MSYSAEIIDYKGKEAVALTAGKYKAIVAPFLGSNVIRMQDVENDIEIFRYDESLSVEDLKKSPEVYGLPTLYLPNRLANGVLKVSDATYHFPLNDPLGNHIHGFLHKREHTLVSAAVDGKKAIAKTEYIYDKNDEFFETYPVSFKAEFTFTLSDDGLEYAFTMTNTSDKQMPYGMCNHTTINGPFTKDGNGLDMRLYIPVGEKWELSKSCIPTGDMLVQTNHDRQYLTGSQVPVLHDIDNDVFFAEEGSHSMAQWQRMLQQASVSAMKYVRTSNSGLYGTIMETKDTSVQSLAHGSSMHQTSQSQQRNLVTRSLHRVNLIR